MSSAENEEDKTVSAFINSKVNYYYAKLLKISTHHTTLDKNAEVINLLARYVVCSKNLPDLKFYNIKTFESDNLIREELCSNLSGYVSYSFDPIANLL